MKDAGRTWFENEREKQTKRERGTEIKRDQTG